MLVAETRESPKTLPANDDCPKPGADHALSVRNRNRTQPAADGRAFLLSLSCHCECYEAAPTVSPIDSGATLESQVKKWFKRGQATFNHCWPNREFFNGLLGENRVDHFPRNQLVGSLFAIVQNRVGGDAE